MCFIQFSKIFSYYCLIFCFLFFPLSFYIFSYTLLDHFILSYRSLMLCLFLFQSSFSVFINLENFCWAFFKVIGTFFCSVQSAVKLIQGIFYFRHCIFQLSVSIGSFFYRFYLYYDSSSLTSRLFMFNFTSLSIL